LESYLKDSSIIDQYKFLTNEDISLIEFTNRYKRKDPFAMKVYSNFIDNVSITVNNISQMLNPKTIVINSVIIENIFESISLIKNNLHSQIMNLDILTISKFRSKTNIQGLTHVLIQDFLNIDNYTPTNIIRN